MDDLSNYPWKEAGEPLAPKASVMPAKRADEPSGDDSEETLPYFFSSKFETSVDDFKKFIEELDQGAGDAELEDDYQTYRTTLKASQAKGLRDKYPFLALAFAASYRPDLMEYWENLQEEYNARQACATASAVGASGTASTNKDLELKARDDPTDESESEEMLPYFLGARYGTPSETFEAFVQELDNGAGKKEVGDGSQTYETKLTASRAGGLREKYPWLQLVLLIQYTERDIKMFNGEIEVSEEYNAIPRKIEAQEDPMESNTSAFEDHTLVKRKLGTEDDAPYWKKMIGSPPQDPVERDPSQDPPYMRDDSLGRGTTIYIIDNGFDDQHPVS